MAAHERLHVEENICDKVSQSVDARECKEHQSDDCFLSLKIIGGYVNAYSVLNCC